MVVHIGRFRGIVFWIGILTVLIIYWPVVARLFTWTNKARFLLHGGTDSAAHGGFHGLDQSIPITVVRAHPHSLTYNPTKRNSSQRLQNNDHSNLVKCKLLIEGDKTEIARAHYVMRLYPIKPNNDSVVSDWASNCTNFIHQRDYVTNVRQEEADFPIAFSVLVFKDSQQVERLLRAIYRPHNIYCIHVDKKSSEMFQGSIRKWANCFDNVFLIDQIDVQWGYFSVLEPEIVCMRELLKSGVNWRYFINLTGQEFPLKTNWELVKILKAMNGANDIAGAPGPGADFRARYVHQGLQPTNTRKPAFPMKIQWMKGGAHIIASRAFVDYVVHNETAHKIMEYLKDTGVPDESFFQTLNNNPQLRAPGAYNGTQIKTMITRYKIWSDHLKPCSGMYVRGICIMGIGDLKRLVKTHQIFVNKIYYNFQYLTMNCLEDWYHTRVHNETISGRPDLNISFYENLPQVKHKVD